MLQRKIFLRDWLASKQGNLYSETHGSCFRTYFTIHIRNMCNTTATCHATCSQVYGCTTGELISVLTSMTFSAVTATVITIQIGANTTANETDNGIFYKITPVTTKDTLKSKPACFRIPGTNDSSVAIQPTLPDLAVQDYKVFLNFFKFYRFSSGVLLLASSLVFGQGSAQKLLSGMWWP